MEPCIVKVKLYTPGDEDGWPSEALAQVSRAHLKEMLILVLLEILKKKYTESRMSTKEFISILKCS